MNFISNIRKEYGKTTIDEKNIAKNPIDQFNKWLDESLAASVLEPTAMTLSTASKHGRPTCRVVLLKDVKDNQFVFYTNLESRKGKELQANPYCSLNFFWPELERQIRIDGIAKVIVEAKATEYFQSRPRESQIGAWVSNQSTKIENRSFLENRYQEIEKRFHGHDKIIKPKQWGGFEVSPYQIEFWQGGKNRLHDRILFTKTNERWEVSRLAP